MINLNLNFKFKSKSINNIFLKNHPEISNSQQAGTLLRLCVGVYMYLYVCVCAVTDTSAYTGKLFFIFFHFESHCGLSGLFLLCP